MVKKKKKTSKNRQKLTKGDENNCIQYSIHSRTDLSSENIINILRYNHYAQILILLTLFGLILRFYHLEFNSLWLDEGATLDFAQRSIIGIWETTAGGEFNPPLFYYLEHAMLIVGNSEWVLRFIPALMGTLTIPVVYLIGREYLDECGGLIAAALVSFSSYHIYYSQEARAYTLVTFFFSLAFLTYIWAIENKGRCWWIVFGILSALAFWSHFYVLIPLAFLYLYALIKLAVKIKDKNVSDNKEEIKNFIYSVLSFIILSLPLIIVTIGLFFKRTSGEPTFGLSGFNVITGSLVSLSNSSEIMAFVFVLLFIAGLIGLCLHSKKEAAGLLLLVVFGTLVLSVMLANIMPWNPRFIIILLPLFFVGMSCSLYWIPKSLNRFHVSVVLVLLLFLLTIPFISTYYSGFSKNDWRGFSELITDTTVPDDVIVLVPDYMKLPFDYYYSNASDQTILSGANNGSELAKTLEITGNGSTAYYAVTWDIMAQNPEGDAVRWLQDNTQYVGKYTGIDLFAKRGD